MLYILIGEGMKEKKKISLSTKKHGLRFLKKTFSIEHRTTKEEEK